MNPKQMTYASKFLSLVLRHQPQQIGITLDKAGWTPVSELIERCRENGLAITLEDLTEIVTQNPKRRFSFSDDRSLIRANQGHSINVDLGYMPATPPNVLFHGTHVAAIDSIRTTGLVKGDRHHVHLTTEVAVAEAVGRRRGVAIVVAVAAGEMCRNGHSFYLSDNDVWLTDCVPVQYLTFERDTP